MMAKGAYQQHARHLSSAPDGSNKIKDLQNFLSISPLQVFNQTPDANGVVEVPIADLQNYT